MANARKLNCKIEQFKAAELLESKTKDLPTFEARRLKKRFAGASVDEIESKFKRVYESVKKEIEEDEAEEEVSLEAEIKDILDSEKPAVKKDIAERDSENVEENDYLRGRSHNGHVAEKDTDGEAEEADEPIETMETYKFDRNGDIVLESDDVIDAAYMKELCRMAERIS